MLPLLIRPIDSDDEGDPEDIFSVSASILFPDDPQIQHGNPGSGVIYSSSTFGDIELRLSDPEGEGNRRLFAHYVWNSGIQMAEFIGGATSRSSSDVNGNAGEMSEVVDWSVNGETVLELGAGTGLGGIMACLANASSVVLTDYPSPPLLDTLQRNAQWNIPPSRRHTITVAGHEWGVFESPGESLPIEKPINHESIGRKPGALMGTSRPLLKQHSFTRILAADCLWMSYQHLNLLQSMEYFLSRDPTAKVWVVAAFHTGREIVAAFFDQVEDVGLEIERLWERDIEGKEREWMKKRESDADRKRWNVVGILKRKVEGNETYRS
ncbi:hypothetical protein MMC25_000759 [Agyrium rufum]|nr:hypothetical protein [Agyrium rufum]